MNNGCISWRSKKQRTVALSSTEAEYMALTEATREAVWLKAFLCELGEMKNDGAVKIYEDNQGSIALVKNPEFYKERSISTSGITSCARRLKTVKCCYSTATKDMKADLMTKPIPAVHFSVSSRLAWNSSIMHCRVEWECCRRSASAR